MAIVKPMTKEQADRFDKGVDPDTGKPVAVAADATATGVDRAGAARAAGAPPASAAPASLSLDRTDLNPYGQKVFGRLVADAIVKTQVELGPDLIGVPGGPTTVQPGGPAGARPVLVPSQPVPRPSM